MNVKTPSHLEKVLAGGHLAVTSECGICYMICPEIDELDEETRKRIKWSPPIGCVLETTVARTGDEKIRKHATDGGVVTALLLHLFDSGKIDGAIVARQTGLFKREPWLATSHQENIEAAGFCRYLFWRHRCGRGLDDRNRPNTSGAGCICPRTRRGGCGNPRTCEASAIWRKSKG